MSTWNSNMYAPRLNAYLFAGRGRLVGQAAPKFVDKGGIVKLHIGVTDLPIPQPILDTYAELQRDPRYAMGYPIDTAGGLGRKDVRETLAAVMNERYGVDTKADDWLVHDFAKPVLHMVPRALKFRASPEEEAERTLKTVGEVLSGYDSSGRGELTFTDFIRIREVALKEARTYRGVAFMKDPAYPAYFSATILADGDPSLIPSSAETGWLPQWSEVRPEDLSRAEALYLCNPDNPTGIVLDEDYYRNDLLDFVNGAQAAHKNKERLLLIHDKVYENMIFDGTKNVIIAQIPELKDCCFESHSLSKEANFTSKGLGFAYASGKVMKVIASDLFEHYWQSVDQAKQVLLMKILTEKDLQNAILSNVKIVESRHDLLYSILRKAGLEASKMRATPYNWFPVPEGYKSTPWCDKVLFDLGVSFTPGDGFGPSGEGYARATVYPNPMDVAKDFKVEEMDPEELHQQLVARGINMLDEAGKRLVEGRFW